MESNQTRRTLLEAAIELFDAQEIRSATIHAISSRAEVSKRTFYVHFRSKDDLIENVLTEILPTSNRTLDFVCDEDTEALVRRIFDQIARQVPNVRWKGDALSRAASEFAGLPEHPAIMAARKYQDKIESALAAKLGAEGYRLPDRLARRLLLILDGAIAHGALHHNRRYIEEAECLAMEMLRSYRDPRPPALSCVPGKHHLYS